MGVRLGLPRHILVCVCTWTCLCFSSGPSSCTAQYPLQLETTGAARTYSVNASLSLEFALPTPLCPAASDKLLQLEIQPAASSQQWDSSDPSAAVALPLLMLNTDGYTPDAPALTPLLYEWRDTTLVDFPNYKAQQPFQFLQVDLTSPTLSIASDDGPLLVKVYNDERVSYGATLSFTIRASCSEKPKCPVDCNGRGLCDTDKGICTCQPGWAGAGCTTALWSLQEANRSWQTLLPGGWAYYGFQIETPGSSVMAELRLKSGDPVLFMKYAEDGFLPFGVPTVFDAVTSADIVSYRPRRSYQRALWHNARAGRVLVGVYNNDDDQWEACDFRLSVVIEPKDLRSAQQPLCPMNCSYPSGHCEAAAVGMGSKCRCSSGFYGDYCQGPLYDAPNNMTLSGVVMPGHAAFFNFEFSPGVDVHLSIKFKHKGGRVFLVAAQNEIPHLFVNEFRILVPPSEGMFKSHIRVYKSSVSGVYTFGIFNVDFFLRRNCTYRIVFALPPPGSPTPSESVPFSKSVWAYIIFAAAVVIFMFIFCTPLICQFIRPARADSPSSSVVDLVMFDHIIALNNMRALDPNVLRTFPLVEISEALFSSLDDTQCAVCLTEYVEGETLRRLPACCHMFHVECVDTWLRHHNTCPLCRTSLGPTAAGVATTASFVADGGSISSIPAERFHRLLLQLQERQQEQLQQLTGGQLPLDQLQQEEEGQIPDEQEQQQQQGLPQEQEQEQQQQQQQQ